VIFVDCCILVSRSGMPGGQDVARLRDDCYRVGGGGEAERRLRSNCDLYGQGIFGLGFQQWSGEWEGQEMKRLVHWVMSGVIHLETMK